MTTRLAETLTRQLEERLRERQLVVWLDRESTYDGFVDRLLQDGSFTAPVVTFRGSYLDTLLALEGRQNGLDAEPLLLHAPRLNDATIRKTPFLELYLAGCRFERNLDTLVREAAAGVVPPEEVERFLAEPDLDLEKADAWLEEQAGRDRRGLASVLAPYDPKWVFDGLTARFAPTESRRPLRGAAGEESSVVDDTGSPVPEGAGVVARAQRGSELRARLEAEADASDVFDYFARHTGFNEAFARSVCGLERPRDLRTFTDSLVSWVLSVEFVDSLRRTPVMEELAPLKTLSAPLRKTSAALARRLRERDPELYRKQALVTEAQLQQELAASSADELERADGFDCIRESAPPTGSAVYDTATYDSSADFGSGGVTQYYIVNGQLRALTRDNASYAVTSDALGSVRLVIDNSGTVVSKFDYDAWGNLLASSFDNLPGSMAYRYVGALGCRWDEDTGLTYLRQRWYQAAGLQRFVSMDMLYAANRYAYVRNNPVVAVDITGMEPTYNPPYGSGIVSGHVSALPANNTFGKDYVSSLGPDVGLQFQTAADLGKGKVHLFGADYDSYATGSLKNTVFTDDIVNLSSNSVGFDAKPFIDVTGIGMRDGRPVWLSDRGEVVCGCSQYDAARAHGDIVRIGRELVNRRRVRMLTWQEGQVAAVLDNGHAVRVVGRATLGGIRQSLGLVASPRDEEISLFHKGLFLYELRDFPQPLLEMTQAQLAEAAFQGASHLMANVLWQAVRKQAGGDCGTTNRGFWYRPLLPVLLRAGFKDDPALYRTFQKVCLTLVGQYRLFKYSDLGFDDHRPDLRAIGTRRPNVVILCEKVSLVPFVRRLGEHFGVSWQVFHGQPKLLDTEFIARALASAGPLHVIAYVDYDAAGWIIADAFVAQLALYGVQTASLEFLVTPARFTAREVKSYAHKLHGGVAETIKIRAWVKRSGGIGGKAMGLYSNHLLPYERVEEAVAALLAADAGSGSMTARVREAEG